MLWEEAENFIGPATVSLAKETPVQSLACAQLCNNLLTHRTIVAACCLVSLRFAVGRGVGEVDGTPESC